MDIYKPGGDQHTFRVDFFVRGPRYRADLHDQAIHNLDIAYKWFATCAINDETVADNESRWVCHDSFL